MHVSIRLSLVTFIACALGVGTLGACATTTRDASVDAPPPAGEALHRAVVGAWHGTAHDGSDTTEDVALELTADGTYTLAAGSVDSSHGWRVEGAVVFLEQDVNDPITSSGICFMATRVDANHIEGHWAWGRAPNDCDTTVYDVVLDRNTDAP